VLDRKDTALWEETDWFVVLSNRHNWNVWLGFHQIVDLSVPVEEHDTCLHHVLEDEVLVIVAALEDVTHYQVIEYRFPLGSYLMGLCEVVNLFLRDLSVENLLVHACSKI